MTLLLIAEAGMELQARDFREVARREGVLLRTLLLHAILPPVLLFALALTVCSPAALAAAPASANAPAAGLLLTDSLGRHVSVPTNEVPSRLDPSGPSGLVRQIPQLKKGAVVVSSSHPPWCYARTSKWFGIRPLILDPARPWSANYSSPSPGKGSRFPDLMTL